MLVLRSWVRSVTPEKQVSQTLQYTSKPMFNPFKVQLSCQTSISTEDRERFLEFIKSQLLMIGCDRVDRIGAVVTFSNNLFSFSRGRYHIMSGVNGGVITFAPVNLMTYEYRITTLGIIMLVFAVFGLLFAGLSFSTPVPDIFPFFFLGVLIFILTINWVTIRYQQKKFMQQFEPEYHRMKQVFTQPK